MKTAIPAVLALAATVLSSQAAVSLTSAGSPYTQNFDSLAATGTAIAWANGSTLPGWSLFRQPSPGTAITAYSAGTGTSNTGNIYSFGSTNSTERALGGVGSGSFTGWIAVNFINDSSSAFNGFNVTWNGEQWRNGGNTNAQTMSFEYGFGPSFDAVSSWTSPGGNFDFSSVVNTTTAAAVDGNNAGRVSGLGGSVSNLTWNNGESLWLRWTETNDAGNDHGLAIDDFSFKATAPSQVSDGGTTLSLLGVTLAALSAIGRRFRRALLPAPGGRMPEPVRIPVTRK
jgi:hypothetical protein